jgi:hypothetical protein
MRCATRYIAFPGIALVWLVSGCASAPIQEMSDARQGLQAAEQAHAADLTPHELADAKRHVLRAEHALDVGAYRRARTEALQAQALAIRARSLAVALAGARAAVDEAKRLGVLPADAGSFLEEAMQAATRGDTDRALALAGRAQELAGSAAGDWYRSRSQQLLDSLQRSAAGMNPEQRARLEKARAAYQRGDSKAAYLLLEPLEHLR